MSDQHLPAVGDHVHFVGPGMSGWECLDAAITEVVPETEDNLAKGRIEDWGPAAMVRVELFVAHPRDRRWVRWHPDGIGGTWHWPETTKPEETAKPEERAVPDSPAQLAVLDLGRTLVDILTKVGQAIGNLVQALDVPPAESESRRAFREKLQSLGPVHLPHEWLNGVDPITQARIAYGAYGAVTDHKNYQGLPMPAFEELPGNIRDAWTASATKLFELGAAWGRFQPERAANGAPSSTEAARLIFEAIGEASMCWADPRAAGEFDSTHAAKVGLDLMRRLGIPIPPGYEQAGDFRVGRIDDLFAQMDAQGSVHPGWLLPHTVESERFQREVPEGSPLTGWLPAEDARPEAGVEPEDT